MGIPVNYPSLVHGDNQSVLWNTEASDLKQKLSAVAYDFVREEVARNEWVTNYVRMQQNPSDTMTKLVRNFGDHKNKVRMMLYDIYPLT
jgi:hypothetical protein